MKRALLVKSVLAACLLSLAAPLAARAAERGTPAQAQAMVARAIALFDKEGAKAAFDRFNSRPGPEFRRGDLYIFVARAKDAVLLAHAADSSLVGRDSTTLIDARGRNIGRDILARATGKGAWSDYLWKDPLSGKTLAKSSWVVRHKGHIFGCGVYKP